jgi:hypothetical protein
MVVCAALLALFLIPGFAWVSWLHSADRLDLPTRLVLGAAWSFAAFAAVAGPFLWVHGSVTAYLTVLAAVWIIASAATGTLYVRSLRQAKIMLSATPVSTPTLARPGKQPAVRKQAALGLLAAYAVLVSGVLAGWTMVGSDPQEWRNRQQWITIGLPAILLVAAFLAAGLARFLEPLLRLGPEDDTLAPRLWSVVAGSFIVLQAVGAVAYNRPDWDDCYYLAAALDYQEGQVLNDQEPTHREGYPVQAIYRLMAWELWGATLGRIAGLGPLVLFHSVLPGLLVLACYAAYRALFTELLPRHWVPLALIGLCGFHLWGISNHGNAANHFLIRIWQGKAMLLHLGIPLTTTALIRFARQPVLRWWLTFIACLACGPAYSSSAIFLSTCLVVCLAPLLLATIPAGKRIAFTAGSILALAPTVGVGFLFWMAVHGDTAYQADNGRTAWQSWFFEWNRYAGNGSAEIIWLAALPFIWILLPGWRTRSLLVGLPVVLILTFANPVLQTAIAARLTGAVAYYRLFWLFPVGIGLGVVLALGSRLSARMLSGTSGATGTWLPLAACCAGLALSAALPGVWVWSDQNSAGPFMTPRLAENLERMPPDLKVIARKLADDPDIAEKRIVCPEEVVSFLTPYDRRFRFVTTRPGYTMYDVGREHRPAEAAERVFLTDGLWLPQFARLPDESWAMILRIAGKPPDAAPPNPWPAQENIPDLLGRYDVAYAVTSPALGRTDKEKFRYSRLREANLRRCGFRPLHEAKDDGYALWIREIRTGPAPTKSDADGN